MLSTIRSRWGQRLGQKKRQVRYWTQKREKSPDFARNQDFLVAEGGFEPPTSGLSLRASCGARKNLRAIRPLDFFDRCANALLAVSAAGGARGRFPTSHARRSHNPEL